jgi:acyl carrier protein phosphodiesterase
VNFLAHLHLSGDAPEMLVGNLMGDFVKGRLVGSFPPGIEQGIRLHRRIDSFAAGNASFRESKARLDPSFGLYRGVMVDLFYDHFLARHWDDYSPIPFDAFVAAAYHTVTEYEGILPERLVRVFPIIFTELIPSYREIGGIERALGRMAARLRRPNPLAEGVGDLVRHYDALHDDFSCFFPEAIAYVRGLIH